VGAFEDLHAIPPQVLAVGYLARVVHGERLTLAVVEVEPGGELPEHRHDNEQLGIVLRGSVIFRVGDEERDVDAGGIWRTSSDTPHMATAGDAGAVVVDIFSPPRLDWMDREVLTPRQPSWP
jgi:quercetin dioxygenase-like cupin family protein